MPPSRKSQPGSSHRRKSSGLILSKPSSGIVSPPGYSRSRDSSGEKAKHKPLPASCQITRSLPNYRRECAILKIPSHPGLHSMQKSVLNDIVSNPNNDQFVIAATGSGKSLLFELPAILPQAEGKVTIVFVPRVAIIRIEHERLVSCGVKVEARFKKSSGEETEVQNQLFFDGMRDPSLLPRILLATPHQLEHTETVFQRILMGLYERGLIQRFVFDEIHMLLDECDRLDSLRALRDKFPDVPVTILSASLSPTASRDLCIALQINSTPKVFPLDRPNLYYRVLPKLAAGDSVKDASDVPSEKEWSQLRPILRLAKVRYPDGAGLVYCRKKDACVRLAKLLSLNGVLAAPYDSERGETSVGSEVFNQWIRNDPAVRILVSTSALSSGVHKSDVRFVVHTSLPTSGIDGYMQETGRAGRDNQKATCLLLYAFSDAFIVSHDTCQATENILALLRFINSSDCRRQTLLSYYHDDSFDCTKVCSRCCDICDNSITSPRPSLDITPIAYRVLRYCEKQHVMVGTKALAQQLQKHFGEACLKETTQDMWRKVVQLLIIEQYLEIDRPGERGGGQVKLVRGPKTMNVLQKGGHKVMLPWSMRFNELYVGKETDIFPLRWTQLLVDSLTEIDVDEFAKDWSPEL